jgi:lysophospholipase L1-like esterase
VRRNLLLLGATLLVLELVARLVLGGAEEGKLYNLRPGDGRCVGLRPGVEVLYTGWFLRIPPVRHEVNVLGFRGPPRPPGKAAGTVRVAVIGDSFVYGLGVGAEDSIPAQLEEILGSRSAVPVEVLNFGIPGAQLDDLIPQLSVFVARWSPDLVVFVLFGNDLDESLCSWVSSPPRLALGLLTWTSYLVRAFHAGYVFLDEGVFNPRGEHPERAVRLRQRMAALVAASQVTGAPLAVVALGDPTQSRQPEVLAEVLDGLGVPWLDARGWNDRKSPAALPIIPGDLHFTPEGNRTAAARIAAWLAEQHLLPPAS